MRLLVLSWYFPPANTMGALRTGKLVKYLLGAGHDVRVVCARDLPFAQTLPLEAPAERVTYTHWTDVNAPPKAVARWLHRLRGRGGPAGGDAPSPAPSPGAAAAPRRRGLLNRLRAAYTDLLDRPDAYVGWYPFARLGMAAALKGWRPDVVFATAPPFTVLLAASHIARRRGIPWVAEYRDRWYEDPYYPYPPARRERERRWEDRLLAGASGIVTVSEPWAEDYRARWGKPVEVVLNGFDPDDFPFEAERPRGEAGLLRIVYTGIIYAGRRDPTPLFEAIRLLGDEARHVRVEFYGPKPDTIEPLIARAGVGEHVVLKDPVPYRDALSLQRAADILLLLQWNDASEAGNCPGKLFEYIGARRPVLALGLEGGVPDTILDARGAGAVINDPARIAERLRQWIAEKRETGEIPDTPPEARAGLSRPEQYARLERFLLGIAGEAEPSPAPAQPERPAEPREERVEA